MTLYRRAMMAFGGLAPSAGFFTAMAALPPGFADDPKE